jgi:hypothetical protein
MALRFGMPEVIRFKHHADRQLAKWRTMQENTAQAVQSVVTSTEVSAASFAFGLVHGKYGGVALFGIPTDLLAGLALHIAAFSGVAGKGSIDHLHAFGDGALASFFHGLGRQVGRTIQTEADREMILRNGGGLVKGGATLGADSSYGTTGGGSLADEELARMVAAGQK